MCLCLQLRAKSRRRLQLRCWQLRCQQRRWLRKARLLLRQLLRL
jgi:hypothetical protein